MPMYARTHDRRAPCNSQGAFVSRIYPGQADPTDVCSRGNVADDRRVSSAGKWYCFTGQVDQHVKTLTSAIFSRMETNANTDRQRDKETHRWIR
ncbi:hypothetical protein PoB_000309700 [Plakobranchus ocellatus]|uniref:Uncharacterized protein n=1 Tax=Plakobranchus ocellatus TaxID=259542 RepID=A0AAV3Y1J5_9GAST|nr:hypothetical protein PoB_000309700 [Plakobranchus ocellatus]